VVVPSTEEHTSSAALALICGVFAMLFGWSVIGAVPGAAAIWFARKDASHSWSKWGVILAIIGFAEAALLFAVVIVKSMFGA
jgi:hypothetical protein